MTCGNDQPLVLRPRVERLAELHDVHAVLAERRADRRRRIRLARGTLQLHDCHYLLGHIPLLRPSKRLPSPFLDASHRSGGHSCNRSRDDGRRPSEHLHHHAKLLLVLHHLVDVAREVREGAGHDPHALALFEVDLGLRLDRAFLDPLGHARHFVVGDRRRRRSRVADEAGDLRSALHDVPGLVVEIHPHEDVAGEELALRGALLPLRPSRRRSPRGSGSRRTSPRAEGARALEQRLLGPLASAPSRCGRCTTSSTSVLDSLRRTARIDVSVPVELRAQAPSALLLRSSRAPTQGFVPESEIDESTAVTRPSSRSSRSPRRRSSRQRLLLGRPRDLLVLALHLVRY